MDGNNAGVTAHKVHNCIKGVINRTQGVDNARLRLLRTLEGGSYEQI